jgi:hypothetical protein
MKRFIFSLPALIFICFSLSGQVKSEFSPPTNIRNLTNLLPYQADLIWTPPPGWVRSPVDRWFDYDRGIYGGNGIGSCPGCPVEIAIRWDSNYFSDYSSIYLTKIRFVLNEAALDHALRVYQVQNTYWDTLFNYPLENNLVYHRFDTLEFSPISVDISKELWVGLWVSDMWPGYPLAVGLPPVIDGYGNLIKFGNWETLMDINPELEYPWNIGAYFITSDDEVNYPVFNVYRSVNEQPFEKIHEGNFYDTVYHDFLGSISPDFIQYYVTSVYEDGESEPSDTLTYSFVTNPEIPRPDNIKVSPNPAKDRVSINSGNGKIKSLSLINTKGEVVLEKFFNTEKVQLNLSAIPSSFYILKVITEDGVFTSKLLIVN